MKSIYTAGPLPFASKEFVVTLPEKDDHEDSSAAAAGSKRSICMRVICVPRNREFKVTLKLSSKPDLYQLQQFLQSQQHESPQEETQVLDVALRAAPPEKYSSFATELGQKGGDLGEGQEYWRGFSQSQFGLSLNIDVSARAIYEPIMVTEFVKKLLSDRQLSRPLPDRDRLKEKKPLKGVQVSLSYEEHTSYEVTGVSVEPQSKLKFTHERYSIGLRDVAMPALQSGRDSKPAYLPMELCTIGSGKRYSRLNERQATALLRATSQSPGDRERSIYQESFLNLDGFHLVSVSVHMVKHNGHNKDELIQREFGMNIREDMTLVNARVLWPPLLKYHHSGREKSENPLMGQWNMINKVWYWLMLDFWAYVDFSLLDQSFNFRFCEDSVSLWNSKGVYFHPQPLLPHQSAHPGKIERVLGDIHKMSSKQLEEVGQKGRHLQLLIIILPDVTGSYEKMIKRFWESELGVVSQCCQPIAASRLSKQYLENLSLEINVKFGGRNTVAIRRRIPLVSDFPTIIFAVDVIHPQQQSVVASIDWPQIIQDLYSVNQDPNNGLVGGGMIREHFRAFRQETGRKPERIILYIDRVSEDQFCQVLLHEMDNYFFRISKFFNTFVTTLPACQSLREGYLPPLTFVVAQTGKSGNFQPFCHPREFNFYLNSHARTNMPVHHHVMYDENKFSPHCLQVGTNNICYNRRKCTRVNIIAYFYLVNQVCSIYICLPYEKNNIKN
ncbi:protein argonaute 5 [Pyrus ussuriensis x Pyrus communis]|uniref:Protein argonaute 5 n=1 Tax=Pyrus ussuriensis x Pyrus communis TaxID=2448454 RepID=A0A5N5H6D2_9ROSA|nr:protein argonaute 5 [Pyrus ussuriensis x Pyrus communis]